MTETADTSPRPPVAAGDLYDRVPCRLLTVSEDGRIVLGGPAPRRVANEGRDGG